MENMESIYSNDNRNGMAESAPSDNRIFQPLEMADIEYTYRDCDNYDSEIAELYTYTEVPEFQLNLKAFEDICVELKVVPLWQGIKEKERTSLVIRMSDYLEFSNLSKRLLAARAALYICQGCWGEVQSDQEQISWTYKNVQLLLECGVWHNVVKLLYMEIEQFNLQDIHSKLISQNLSHSTNLRVVLSIMYTIVETIRTPQESEDQSMTDLRQCFREELSQVHIDSNELLAMTLMGMVTKFCNSSALHFPIKKVLLLLWKILLFSLGGIDDLKVLKDKARKKANLSCDWEDTLETSKTMRASSPPATASEQLNFIAENHQRKRPLRRQSLLKQSSLDDSVAEMELTDEEERIDVDEPQLPTAEERPQSPIVVQMEKDKGLPWTPKVRQRDIDAFLNMTRMKFLGYSLEQDRTSLVGLPLPIHEGMDVLKKHIYVSLSEVQIKREDEITKYPMSAPEEEIPENTCEILYREMLLTLPQCMIALLKILLAATPTSKSKTESINIMADVMPDEVPTSVMQSVQLTMDVNRHKEILVKAVSAILLLLLKHFKINHVYQFEFMSQHLVFANCIPLVLKFFNQNLIQYVQGRNSIGLIDFPSCVIGERPDLTLALETSRNESGYGETISSGGDGGSPNGSIPDEVTSSFCCQRNMFSCINLLRILNKLCKWKHSRIMMLVVFKSAPILKRSLKVRHPMMQLYILKLLKTQTKYLGRQWRKTNMKTLSAIYQKVRHRLNDDWAYGNDPDARPWDFQAEECALRACVDRFNSRRYGPSQNRDPDFEPVDNCVTSVLGRHVELTEEFKQHYAIWLEREVLTTNIDWDQLITSSA